MLISPDTLTILLLTLTSISILSLAALHCLDYVCENHERRAQRQHEMDKLQATHWAAQEAAEQARALAELRHEQQMQLASVRHVREAAHFERGRIQSELKHARTWEDFRKRGVGAGAGARSRTRTRTWPRRGEGDDNEEDEDEVVVVEGQDDDDSEEDTEMEGAVETDSAVGGGRREGTRRTAGRHLFSAFVTGARGVDGIRDCKRLPRAMVLMPPVPATATAPTGGPRAVRSMPVVATTSASRMSWETWETDSATRRREAAAVRGGRRRRSGAVAARGVRRVRSRSLSPSLSPSPSPVPSVESEQDLRAKEEAMVGKPVLRRVRQKFVKAGGSKKLEDREESSVPGFVGSTKRFLSGENLI